jgi:hypothetical protein
MAVALQRRPSKSTTNNQTMRATKIEKQLEFVSIQQTLMAFGEWAQNNEVLINNVWFSDEAHFHLDGVVNKQDVRFCASEDPHMILATR